MNYLYLAVNMGAFLVPFIFSFHPKINFYKKWKFVIPAIILSAIPFLIWDIYFTKQGVWGFSPVYVTGIYFLNLPIEEVLFFICIPYSCLFTYHCFNKLLLKDYFFKIEKAITFLLLILLVVTAISNYEKLYTIYTFSLLALILMIIKFILNANWLSRFYFSYTILLLPFTIVNGILTGTGLNGPVVWYNDQENLGIRILTIPFEDIFYGMLLFLLNTMIVELLEKSTTALKWNERG